ncbi:MAG: hypothetical protein HYY20_08000, partial [Candidatus Tectomicrobia bacterium]|nr:hypothetical protein [Candidatus Tectomicrobia bacterium]
MGEPLHPYPTGLTREQLAWLTQYTHHAASLTASALLEAAQRHLHQASIAHQRNPLVNLRLATAICDTIHRVTSDWHALAPGARAWLAGAILYFAQSNDGEPDLTTPIGFEDDAEVLNACLRFAHLGA